MINHRHLVRPNPNDSLLFPNNAGLAMIEEGDKVVDTFYYSKGKPNKLNNMTGDPFNHIISTGGYHDSGATIIPGKEITALQSGGIVSFAPSKSLAHNPVPVRSALIDMPQYPKVNHLVDAPVPLQINPIVAPI